MVLTMVYITLDFVQFPVTETFCFLGCRIQDDGHSPATSDSYLHFVLNCSNERERCMLLLPSVLFVIILL
jgi:hypothetical protein